MVKRRYMSQEKSRRAVNVIVKYLVAVSTLAFAVFIASLFVSPQRNPLTAQAESPRAEHVPVARVFSLGQLQDEFAYYQETYGEYLPMSLQDCFMSLAGKDLAVFDSAWVPYRAEEGYVFYLYTIPLSRNTRPAVTRVLLNSGREYAYPRNVVAKPESRIYTTTIGSGPRFWRGTWLVSLNPDIGTFGATNEGTAKKWVNPIYYFPPEGGAAEAWLPDALEFGVLGFDVEGDELYVVPATDCDKARETMLRREVPKGQLLVMNWGGQVLRQAALDVNYCSLGVVPVQSVDVRVVDGEVYVLNRVPTADAMPSGPYEDQAPVPDLIAPGRIDVFDEELNHVRSLDLHHSRWTGRYYFMDIDQRTGLILLLEYATGQAWLYNLKLELLRHYSEHSNWGITDWQDFVLSDGLIYIPEVMGQSDTIVTYELGYQLRDAYETGETSQ